MSNQLSRGHFRFHFVTRIDGESNAKDVISGRGLDTVDSVESAVGEKSDRDVFIMLATETFRERPYSLFDSVDAWSTRPIWVWEEIAALVRPSHTISLGL